MLRQPGLDERRIDGFPIALSIVIATHNRYPMLRGAIAAVERQTLDGDAFELIIVDNGSDPETRAAFLTDLSVDCHCDYAVEELPGAARARNIGTGLARGEVVAFLDDDAVPAPGWADAVLARFAATRDVGVMGGPVVPIWAAARPAWLPRWADKLLSALDHGPAARVVEAGEHLISANMAFRKTALEAAGGFPEHLGRRGTSLLTNEDLALRRAIVERGWKAFYDPLMLVHHHIHADRLTQGWLRRRMAWQIVSDLIESGGDDMKGEDVPGPAVIHRLLGDRASGTDLDALLADHPHPDEVTRQMMAVRVLLRLLLATPDRPADG